MQYTIGTKVVIISEVPDHGNWVIEMNEWLGQVMTVRETQSDQFYRMEEDSNYNRPNGWVWNECFIDHAATAKLNSPIEEPEYTDSYGIDYYTDKVYNMFSELDSKGILFSDDCQYSKKGIRANVEEWYKQKNKLFGLFSKHPNWNEEAKAIVFLKTEHREPDSMMFANCYDQLFDHTYDTIKTGDGKETAPVILMRELHNPDTWEERCQNGGLDLSSWAFEIRSEYDVFKYVFRTISRMKPLNVLNEKTADCINGLYPSLKVRPGMKTSRAVNKLFALFGFDKLPEYNRIFAKLSDSLNPFDVERITVLSLNIIDFLMMSNGNSWRSCHTILDDGGDDNYHGCYKGGTLSYANDSESIIMYTVDKSYTGTDWCFEPKITRQILFWDYPVLVQERLYPQCNDNTEQGASLINQYRTIAEDVISTCLGLPNLWVKENKNRARIDNRKDTFMYHDWEHFKNYIVHIKKDVIISDSEVEEAGDTTDYLGNYAVRSAKTIAVGGNSFCTKCGNKKVYRDYSDSSNGESTLLCSECCGDNSIICANCGYETDEDEAVYYNGEWYCRDCCTYCNYHERYEPDCCNDFTYVENYGDVCDDAIENGEFYRCDHCGDWYVYSADLNECGDDYLCHHCFNEHCYCCDECGEAFYKDDLTEIDGCYYCSECAEEISEEQTEETA